MQQPAPPVHRGAATEGTHRGGRGNFPRSRRQKKDDQQIQPRPAPPLAPAPRTDSALPLAPSMSPAAPSPDEVYVSIILAAVPHH